MSATRVADQFADAQLALRGRPLEVGVRLGIATWFSTSIRGIGRGTARVERSGSRAGALVGSRPGQALSPSGIGAQRGIAALAGSQSSQRALDLLDAVALDDVAGRMSW